MATPARCEPGNVPADAMRFKYGGFEFDLFPADAGPDFTGCIWARGNFDTGLTSEDIYRFERGQLLSFKNVSRRGTSAPRVITECIYAGKTVERTVTPAGVVSDRECLKASEASGLLPRHYSSERIEGQVVDAETGQPLEGVIALANWTIKGPFEGAHIGQLQILESVTDASGRYYFPAWGPKIVPLVDGVDGAAPTLLLFKPGYRLATFWNSQLQRGASSAFIHNKKTLRLERFKGSPKQYAEIVGSLSYSLMHIGHEAGRQTGSYCDWQAFPRMLRTLEGIEAELLATGVNAHTIVSFLKTNDKRMQEHGCASIFIVLRGVTN